MSKNTGTSELINYFDLGVNGDVGISGNLTLDTIVNAVIDTDKFLVSDNGIIKYRTGAELLSDIGGQGALTNPVTGTGTSGTIPIFTGSTTLGDSIIQANTTQVNIVGNGSQLLFDSLGSTKNGGIGYINDFVLNVYNSRGTGSAIQLGNENLNLITGSTTRLTILDTGNVLIGTTSDNGARLQVSGGSRLLDLISGGDSFARVTGNRGNANDLHVANLEFYNSNTSRLVGEIRGITGTGGTQSNSGQLAFYTNDNGTYAERFRIASTGAATFSSSVNIGASATTGKQLIVNQSGASGYFLSGEASGTEIAYWYYNANVIQFSSKSAARALTFLTTDTERMRITSGGDVRINHTIDFGATFSVKKTAGRNIANFSNQTDADLNFTTSEPGATPFARITPSVSGQPIQLGVNNNNVLIGTTTDSGSRLRISGGNLQIDGGFQRMYTYFIIVNPSTTGTITISSPTGTNMQGSMQVMAGGYGNSLSGNITGLWMVGGLLFFNNASTSTITQIVNSVTANGSMSFQRNSNQYTVTLANTSSTQQKTFYVSVIINGT